jgi:hypothetical protein
MCRVLRRNTQQTLLFAESFFLVKIFVVIDFFSQLDQSSYSKNYASIIYFECYKFYNCRYFKLDLSFYTFTIIF